MATIQSTTELPAHVWLRYVLVRDEAEAAQIAGAQTAYLYRSKVNGGLYLYIPVKDEAHNA